MAAADLGVAVQPGPAAHTRPYVGLRPFEKHERDLFRGRERDAQFLVDKILSAKLTILFAQSGVGKSSLLHTLTIPELENEQCFAVYFNSWAGRDAVGNLKSALLASLREEHVPDPGAGAPSIKELIRLLAAATGKTTVLVLDQFEELLAGPGEAPGPLRRELAEIVRATDVDARIVIALREEFLAALEPFRSDIVNMFQSTFRLDRLDEAGIRKAITEPAGLFGVTYDPELLDRLLADLKAGGAARPDLAPNLTVELPMLQLVCDQLWTHGVKRGLTTFTPALYDELGGAKKIITEYVRRTMPRRWSDKKAAARMLKFLAPPSGLKMSYSVADLAAYTHLAPRRIDSIFRHLCSSGILKSRVLQGEERFELCHDAFIKILVPWREEVLRRASHLRLAGVAAALVLVAIVGPAVGRYAMNEFEYHREVRRKLPLLTEHCESDPGQAAKTLEDITRHLLLRSSRTTRLDDLKQLLAANERCLPASYGLDPSGIGFVDLEMPDQWPARLRYSSSRPLNAHYFAATWHNLATKLANDWGVPVPSRISLIEEPTMPPRLVELVLPGVAPLQLEDVPTHETGAFLSKSRISTAAAEFIGRFASDWSEAPEIKHGGPWFAVKRWAMPILTATGDVAIDGSGYLALRLVTELQAKPEYMLTPGALELLLERAEKAGPDTVTEVRRVRGDLLRGDLVALLRRDVGLAHLPMILDALARYPADVPSEQVAELVKEDVRSPAIRPAPRARFRQAASIAPKPPVPIAGGQHESYKEVQGWLPKFEPPIRVYVGRDLAAAWTTGRDTLHPELLEELELLRDETWRRFGVEVPGVSFRGYRSLPGWAFQIEMLNEEAGDPHAGVMEVRPADAMKTLIGALRWRVERQRIHWLTAADLRNFLRGLDPPARTWIESRYSLTELKSLLRGVISPSPEELERTAQAERAPTVQVDPSSSLRHPEWLVRSLVFWSATGDPTALSQMAHALRLTQAAAVSPPPVPQSRSLAHVRQGIDALESGRMADAGSAFAVAVRSDREGSIRSFLAMYPSVLNRRVEAGLGVACADPTRADLTRAQRVDIQDRTAREKDRRLKLCQFAAQSNDRARTRRALAAQLFREHADLTVWPPAESAWFAEQVVSSYDPLRDPPESLASASTFLKDAFRRVDYEASWNIVTSVVKACSAEGPKNWCWGFLDDLARVRPEGVIPDELAWQLSWRSRPADLKRAIEWADVVESRARQRGITKASPLRHLDISLTARALALKSLAEGSEQKSLDEAERLFRQLLASQIPEISLVAHEQLIELYLGDGRLTEADALLATALSRWPKGSTFYIQKFWVDLLGGRTQAAAATARRADEQASTEKNEDSIGLLFVAALGQILTQSGSWEHAARRLIGSTHQYVDYIHMMLYASLAESKVNNARELLDQRWARINRASWDARMRHGDESAWREMLIGYSVGEVTRADLIGTLEDDALFAKSAFAQLPLPRKGLLCEAYFYDAVLAKAAGQKDRMRQSLAQTIDTQMRFYFEYKMAKFMLANDAPRVQTASR